jgi:membrane-bound inhibitor of C-type lysozyme
MTRCVIVACLLLAGCAAAPGGAREVTYLCDGGRLATVTFTAETARVRLANDQFELRHERAASGARYNGARGTLHTKDDEALLTVDGRQLGPCQEVKPKETRPPRSGGY